MADSAEGRVAVVTGASRGIGAAIAQRFASDGIRVAAVARTLDADASVSGSLQETVEAIRAAGGTAEAFRADISRPEDRRSVIASVLEHFGTVDILVNDAAVTFLTPVEDFSEKRLRLMFEVQVFAPFELSQLVLPGMKSRGEGWILNISSRAGVNPIGPPFEDIHAKGGFSAYGMCKAALERFSTGLASEVHAHGIAVNALAPWKVVPTHGSGAHDLVLDQTEPPEVMAEAALALCTGPSTLTGRVAYSGPLLGELKRQPRSLTGAPIGADVWAASA